MSTAQAFSYDVVPYPSHPHPQTHPSRVGAIGRLFGLPSAPVEGCRVLELGCGDGANLVPMAWALPGSEFVGIDLARQPIGDGRRLISELGLDNIRLHQASIADIRGQWTGFDYVIAHGIYSWVPAEVREALLGVCRDSLNPHGIAYVSYNALPGCRLRHALREMLLLHVRSLGSAGERLAQARALARWLAEAQDTQDPYRLWLKAEALSLLEHEDGHLFHDDLAEINEPFYFAQFVEQARRHGLQYLGEADYFEMSDHIFSDAVRQTLAQLAANRIVREQYLDFLKCRRFRQTLLCREGFVLQVTPDPAATSRFWIGSSATCVGGRADLGAGVPCAFAGPKGSRVETDFPPGKAALASLEAAYPTLVPFDELAQQSRDRLRQAGIPEGDGGTFRDQLQEFLLRIYGAGAVEFQLHPPAIARVAGAQPATSPLVRWQVQRGDYVTSLTHVTVKVGDRMGHELLGWLDGRLDRSVLAEKLWQRLRGANAVVSTGEAEEAARRKVEADLDTNLNKLARLGLLLA